MEGYNKSIENIRKEFSRLLGDIYLDHAGATLYAKSQLEALHLDFMGNIYGNPHSPCASSRLSTDTIEQVRYRILQHLNTSSEHHTVIFTAGCTAALKLLAENFDWTSRNSGKVQDKTRNKANECQNPGGSQFHSEPNTKQRHIVRPEELQQDLSQNGSQGRVGLFCYLMDNHTSVVGMREIARAKGAEVLCATYDDIQNGLNILENVPEQQSKILDSTKADDSTDTMSCSQDEQKRRNCLFAYPAQSNFSGAKYPIHLVDTITSPFGSNQQDHWAVLLDAASLVSTSPLDLKECKAEFVAVSFYKMFGFPTGIGALIVRNDAGWLLRKTYFGGGTVQAYLARSQFHAPKPSLSDQFEDGTLPFLNIIALKHGFDTIERLAGSMSSISDHTFSLARYVHHKLVSYCHGNGFPVAKLYCHGDFENKDYQGPIVNFNLLRSTGEYVGYAQVERLASLHRIHLRTGCFCNTGACQQHLGLMDEQILNNFQAGHVCGDEMDLINGQPTGSVRISFGYMSTLADADQFLAFVEECFIERTHLELEISNCTSTVENIGMSKVETDRTLQEMNSCQPTNSSIDSSVGMCMDQDAKLSSVQDSGLLQTFEEKDAIESDIRPPCSIDNNSCNAKNTPSSDCKVLTNICLYPVKSCKAFEVSEWEIGPKGLLYDRHWMVVNDSGVCLSQKRVERLCLIKPSIDLKKRCLWLQCQGYPDIRVPLDVSSDTNLENSSKNHAQSKVCLDRVKTLDCGDTVAKWLSTALGRQCRLLQQNPDFERNCKLKGATNNIGIHHSLSLVNESPFTLLCRSSAHSLLKAIMERNHTTNMQPIRSPPRQHGDQSEPVTAGFPLRKDEGEWSDVHIEELIGRFRGNLVIDGWEAFDEDGWQKIQIGHHVFPIAGVCIRCQMVCVDQKTAVRNKEPLMTLSSFRGKKVPFGIHLFHDDTSSKDTTLRVGDKVSVLQYQCSNHLDQCSNHLDQCSNHLDQQPKSS